MAYKNKLIFAKRHFRASDYSVVTFTPRNYALKSNFRKHCCLCYDNEIGPGQKIEKKSITQEINVKHVVLLRVSGNAYKFVLHALNDAEIYSTTNSNNYIE